MKMLQEVNYFLLAFLVIIIILFDGILVSFLATLVTVKILNWQPYLLLLFYTYYYSFLHVTRSYAMRFFYDTNILYILLEKRAPNTK